MSTWSRYGRTALRACASLDKTHCVDIAAAHGAQRVVLATALLHEPREAHGMEAVAARRLQRLAEVGARDGVRQPLLADAAGLGLGLG